MIYSCGRFWLTQKKWTHLDDKIWFRTPIPYPIPYNAGKGNVELLDWCWISVSLCSIQMIGEVSFHLRYAGLVFLKNSMCYKAKCISYHANTGLHCAILVFVMPVLPLQGWRCSYKHNSKIVFICGGNVVVFVVVLWNRSIFAVIMENSGNIR